MVTPGNVLVPPIWHFILLHHPLPSAFPSPHTGITLIMIIAVMIMITTAKLHSLSHIQHPGDYDWLKGCLRMFPSPRFFRLSSISLCFFPPPSFFDLFGFFILSPCSLLSSLTPSSAHLLSLFSLFQFSGSLSSLLLCSFQPFLVHLSSATCPRLSPCPLLVFRPRICSFSPAVHSSPLMPPLILPPQKHTIHLLLSHIAFRK